MTPMTPRVPIHFPFRHPVINKELKLSYESIERDPLFTFSTINPFTILSKSGSCQEVLRWTAFTLLSLMGHTRKLYIHSVCSEQIP